MTTRRGPDGPADAPVCRRSPHLVAYWRSQRLIIENYATGLRVAAPALTCEILDHFDDWRPVAPFVALYPASLRRAIARAITRLIRSSLLQRAGQAPSPRERAMDAWHEWNPSAGFFHQATRDVAFLDMARQVRSLRRRARAAPIPPPIKRYPGAPIVALTRDVPAGEYADVLLGRRTWRRFGASAVSLDRLGTLLGLTAGIQAWAVSAAEGRVALKTSPSGGARHAIELYLVARRVSGLPAGVYHYAADAHGLERLPGRATRRTIEAYLPNQWWYGAADAMVLFSSVFARELWRYPYPRAYRAVLIEAGHLCQTFCLTATWLGLAPFCSMALADTRIERDLGLDGVSESVLYAAGVGTRPPDAAWDGRTAAGSAAPLRDSAIARFPGRLPRRPARSTGGRRRTPR